MDAVFRFLSVDAEKRREPGRISDKSVDRLRRHCVFRIKSMPVLSLEAWQAKVQTLQLATRSKRCDRKYTMISVALLVQCKIRLSLPMLEYRGICLGLEKSRAATPSSPWAAREGVRHLQDTSAFGEDEGQMGDRIAGNTCMSAQQ